MKAQRRHWEESWGLQQTWGPGGSCVLPGGSSKGDTTAQLSVLYLLSSRRADLEAGATGDHRDAAGMLQGHYDKSCRFVWFGFLVFLLLFFILLFLSLF